MTRRPLPRALRPFEVRQFRFLAGALTLSLFGTGTWLVAVTWQVIRLGGGPSQLSQVATASAAGVLAAVLFGGVLADRVPQRLILITLEGLKATLVTLAAWAALTGALELGHLVALAFVIGATDGFFYPAYSALLPNVLPSEQLLAANGTEGVLRPALMTAAGPAVASMAIAAHSPGLAFVIVAASQVLAVVGLLLMGRTVFEHDDDGGRSGAAGVLRDVRDGFVYMARTPWLLGTLLFATAYVLVVVGPIEVLLPFAVRDQAGGGPGEYAVVLASYGIASAVGSLAVASWRLPRRYLTTMVLFWGIGAAPLALVGITTSLGVMATAAVLMGVTGGAAQVVWGTLLQRRVPKAMLGRVSSLDFFVSALLMPVSMAVAGPAGEAFGLRPVFLLAGLLPAVFAVVAIALARMARDELAHPLDLTIPEAEQAGRSTGQATGTDTATVTEVVAEAPLDRPAAPQDA